jgi:WD40 repeat protein/tRNA A-37 threonylcarbamoyl transferase component Bud32
MPTFRFKSSASRRKLAGVSDGSLKLKYQQGLQLGDYVLDGLLRKGPTSSVWRATDRRNRTTVALKIYEGEDNMALMRFRREADILQRLLQSHPNIVPILGYGTQENVMFMVMKLVQGETLQDFINRQRAARSGTPLMNLQQASLLAKTLCEAISYIHAKGIIHRDLKPGNIVLEPGSGKPIIDGFDLVKPQDDIRMTNDRIDFTDTLLYSAPELLTGAANPSVATDIYSLSAILYELITGSPPINGPDKQPLVFLGMLMNNTPVAPTVLNRALPPELDEVLLKALEKNPERRYQSARQFYDAFMRASRLSDPQSSTMMIEPSQPGAAVRNSAMNVPPPATPPDYYLPPSFSGKKRRNNGGRLWLAISGIVVVLVVVAAGVFLMLNNRSDSTSGTSVAQVTPRGNGVFPPGLFNGLQRNVAAHEEPVLAIAFSPNGKLLATASADSSVKIWDTANGQLITTLSGHDGSVNSVAFSPNGASLLTASEDNTVKIWNTGDFKLKTTLSGHSGGVLSAIWSPDSKQVATASEDTTIRLWETDSGKEKSSLAGHTEAVTALAFSPDGKTLISGSVDTKVIFWETATSRRSAELTVHNSPVKAIALSPDGKGLVTGTQDGVVNIFEVGKDKPRLTLKPGSPVNGMVFSPDGKICAAPMGDGTIRIWEFETGKTRSNIKAHDAPARGLAFSPDGTSVASVSDDKTLKIWKI